MESRTLPPIWQIIQGTCVRLQMPANSRPLIFHFIPHYYAHTIHYEPHALNIVKLLKMPSLGKALYNIFSLL